MFKFDRWIKTTEKSKNLTVLKQSDKDFLRFYKFTIFQFKMLFSNMLF